MRARGVRLDLPDRPDLASVVAVALAEDLGEAGDVSAAATVPEDLSFRGEFVARERGIAAGIDVVAAVYAAVDADVAVTVHLDDGARVGPGTVLAEIMGPGRAVLTGERTARNLLGHLCGIATATRAYVDAVEGTGAVIRHTRETAPGLRALQRGAVAAGGGRSHRMGLSDGLVVHHAHITAAGSVGDAVRAALAAGEGLPVQVEVGTLEALDEALVAGARSVLVEGFGLPDLHEAVARCRAFHEPVFLEVSGGVTLDSVVAIARTGVDAIAVGALTHSVRTLDIGLDVVAAERAPRGV